MSRPETRGRKPTNAPSTSTAPTAPATPARGAQEAISPFVTRAELGAMEERLTRLITDQLLRGTEPLQAPQDEQPAGQQEAPPLVQGAFLPEDDVVIIPRVQPVGPPLTSAFSRQIIETKPPAKFKLPSLESYKGRGDPADHLASFESKTSLLDLNDAVKCRLFLTTLKETALRWFSRIPVGTISSFAEFRQGFLTQFASAQRPMKSVQSLFCTRQGGGGGSVFPAINRTGHLSTHLFFLIS